jgi:hypothetical protein
MMMKKNKWVDLTCSVLAGICLGFLLARLDGQGDPWRGWLAFSLLSSLGLAGLVLAWRWAGSKKWLGLLLLLAFILRLGIGVGLSFALPAFGYETEVQRAGYNSADAYKRDMQAWELAASDRPLLDAFDKTYAIDQYGGLEGMSALVYRTLSPDAHRPWLILVMAAAVASLGIAFLWMAARSVWDERLAGLAVWIFALYPESIWLGGSQMREPFLVTFSALMFWGVVDWQIQHNRNGWVWLAAGLAGMLLFSPGVAIFWIILLEGWVWIRSRYDRIPWRILAVGAGVLVAGILLLWAGLARGTLTGAPLVTTLTEWFKLSVKWDVYQLERDSGVIQHLFTNNLNPQLKLPFIFIYGLLQPVLPAAIFDVASWVWKAVGILRSLGWYLALPLLVSSLVAILKIPTKEHKHAWLWLFIVTWAWISISALRAGGDQWDNPRYRVILLVFQALLAAKAWLYYRDSHNPILTRILWIEAFFLLMFMDWYATRFYPFIPRLSFKVMIALITLFAVGLLSVGFIVDRSKKVRQENKVEDREEGRKEE